MARKNGNEFEKLVSAVNETRDVQEKMLGLQEQTLNLQEQTLDLSRQSLALHERSFTVQEQMLGVQSRMLTRLEGVETEMRDLRTSVVASVERVLENFVETKIVSKSDHSALERRVELLEKTVFPPKD